MAAAALAACALCHVAYQRDAAMQSGRVRLRSTLCLFLLQAAVSSISPPSLVSGRSTRNAGLSAPWASIDGCMPPCCCSLLFVFWTPPTNLAVAQERCSHSISDVWCTWLGVTPTRLQYNEALLCTRTQTNQKDNVRIPLYQHIL